MKIEYAASTGNPFGQFVVYPESELDKTILHNFLQGPDYGMTFWLHGFVHGEHGYQSFNFGWIKKQNGTEEAE